MAAGLAPAARHTFGASYSTFRPGLRKIPRSKREYPPSGVGMRVFVLGGTGSIGGPVVRELIRAGHEVVALARSADSASALARIGARSIAGDLATPQHWLAALPPL